jgi:hypothetical protein
MTGYWQPDKIKLRLQAILPNLKTYPRPCTMRIRYGCGGDDARITTRTAPTQILSSHWSTTRLSYARHSNLNFAGVFGITLLAILIVVRKSANTCMLLATRGWAGRNRPRDSASFLT